MMESLDLEFKKYRCDYDVRNNLNKPYLTEEQFLKKIKKEKDINAKIITEILEKHLKERKFFTVKERNYVGVNVAPFDLTAGDQNELKIYGFEIKADKDTFGRLDNQLNQYNFICEDIYLVLHKKKAPLWLPYWCGILRISEKGEIYQEKTSYSRDPFDISTGYEWLKIAEKNGLGKTKDRLQEIFKEMIGIRKNILFNRYFATSYDGEHNSFSRFFPLTEEQKALIIGFDVPYHLRNLNKEVNLLEKRFNLIKQALSVARKKD